MDYQTFTLAQKPLLEEQIDQLSQESWPEFLLHGNAHHWGALFHAFPEYQILFCEPEDRLIAVGHQVPLVWDGTKEGLPADIEGILTRAVDDQAAQRAPTASAPVAAMVKKSQHGKGLSSELLRAMMTMAASKGISHLIAPVRPTLKHRYPLTPLERYVQWRRPDGAPFDPWIRVHWRLGAQQLSVAPNTLTVDGSVAEWETWTKMSFPESGLYVVEGALQPVQIDFEKDLGHYEDPNIWMVHSITAED